MSVLGALFIYFQKKRAPVLSGIIPSLNLYLVLNV